MRFQNIFIKTFLYLFCSHLISPLLFAAEESLTPIIDQYRKAVSGDANSLTTAMIGFEGVVQKYPHNNLARMYLGSTYTLKARNSWMPWEKFEWANKGLTVMDAVVQKDPKNVTYRKMRLLNNINLPKVLERASFIKADLDFLLSEFQRSGETIPEQQALLKKVGEFYEKGGEPKIAVGIWQKMIELDKTSVLAKSVMNKIPKAQ